MKKNLLLAVCFCLLMGVTATAAQIDGYDSIIAYGATKMNDAKAANIFTAYVEDWYGNIYQDNSVPPSILPDGTIQNLSTGGQYEWSYSLLVSQSTDEWFLIRNDYVCASCGSYELDKDWYGDFYVTIPAWGTFVSSAWNELTSDYGVTFKTSGNNNKLNHYYFTMWAPEVADLTGCFDELGNPTNNCAPTVPEPGSILLLGTGIIGLGFAAKRKLGKK